MTRTTALRAAPRGPRNDTDKERSRLTAVLASKPRRGTVALKADGSVVYTPKRNLTGLDTFTYRARDAQGALSAPVATKVTVSP